MPTLTADFTDPYLWSALGQAIVNGLKVLVVVSAVAAGFVFTTGGTAPRNWPKRDEAEAHHH